MGIVNRLWELRTDSRGTHHRKIRVYPMVTADEQSLVEQRERHGSMKAGAQVHWLWHRVLERHGYWVVGCSSRRIPRGRVAGRELGEEEQRPHFTHRTSREIDAGDRAYSGEWSFGQALAGYLKSYLLILAVTSTSTNLPSSAKSSTKQNSICGISSVLFPSRRPLSSSTFVSNAAFTFRLRWR